MKNSLIAALLLKLATISLVVSVLDSCVSGGNQDHAQSQATPAASPTPMKANPDELAGLVARFYRDVSSQSKDRMVDLGTILSARFLKAHNSDWVQTYGFISDARVSVDSVHDRSVDYTVDYNYVGTNGNKINWERIGTWYLIHGSATGWQLDGDDWKSTHITSLVVNGNVYPVHDKVYADGRRTFHLPWGSQAFSATNKGWKFVAIPVANPAVVAAQRRIPTPAPRPNSYAPRANKYAAPVARAAGVHCEDVDVSGVYNNGAILELSNGRHLRVSDADKVTSSVWTAPFNGLMCVQIIRYQQQKMSNQAVGEVTYFKRFEMQVRTGRDSYRDVHLHQGTVINPRGASIQAGQRVEVGGDAQPDGSLNANVITIVP